MSAAYHAFIVSFVRVGPCPNVTTVRAAKRLAINITFSITKMSTPMDVDPPASKPTGSGKDKPRFEVKKVQRFPAFFVLISFSVERCSSLGLGLDRGSPRHPDACRHCRR